ncbi:MAG: phosphoenolpyruvate carboxykinase (GTP) [Oscillospiraceae bacterium]|nr:phosphoenolpyruvate carboxykinase (GTP) [Oscillospiraceae bacterium]
MTQPDETVWIDGSEEQLAKLRLEAVKTGEIIKLNEKELPGCFLHRSDPRDVARVEERTFICTKDPSGAGPTNNRMAPEEMYGKLRDICTGAMRGRTMYVIPYSLGVIGSEFAKYGIELTDSVYVVLSMAIMTHMGKEVYKALGSGSDFIKGLHTKAKLDPEQRYIAHFPEDKTIISVNSAYGGNVLLGKKCFALRMASVSGRDENRLAEHMLILEVEDPKGRVRYLSAAFPSACGKTNLAMLVPPEIYRDKGWKIRCVGDDIAWLKPGEDGRLWAVNPENGFFGVLPGTNERSNPNALAAIKKNTLYTNVVLTKENTVWWERLDGNPPRGAVNWKGEPWDPDDGSSGAHPNSRFTTPAVNCPCLSREYFNPVGVPISAIVFGGRRTKTAPLVYQSRDWTHGVFAGSIMASETTAAAAGAVGVVRRDPMAMLPFCGYDMGDYWRHWLNMGAGLEKAPKIFSVNWFRKNDDGSFIWPGFGENIRVLEWILARCFDEVEADISPLGFIPKVSDINTDGLDISPEALERLLSADKSLWESECGEIREFYSKFGGKLPEELLRQLEILENNVGTME